MANMFWKDAVTGGGVGALDGIDGSILANKDYCVVATSVGVYHYVLVADHGGAPNGVDVVAPLSNAGAKRWVLQDVRTPSPAVKNFIINGDMRIWQRGASIVVPASAGIKGTADMWIVNNTTSGALSVSQDTDTPGNPFRNSLKISVTTADTSLTSSERCRIYQTFEGYNYRYLIEKTVTLQFWVKSSLTGTYCVAFGTGSGTINRSYVVEYTIDQANTWEQKTITVPMTCFSSPDFASLTALSITFTLASHSDFWATPDACVTGEKYATSNQVNFLGATGRTFFLTGVQLVTGSQSLPFIGRDISEELNICQRYYEKTYALTTAPGTVTAVGRVLFTTVIASNTVSFRFAVRKARQPVVTVYTPVNGTPNRVINYTANVDVTPSSVTASEYGFEVAHSIAASQFCGLHWTAECL